MERYRELSCLHALFKQCTTGAGRVAVICGPAATGKTALLRVFAEHAVEAGALVLSAAASRAEHELPLAVLDQLLRNVESAAADVGRELPPLNDTVTRVLNSRRLDVTAYLASPSVRGLLGRLQEFSAERPVLICVDDVQHADEPSLQCLLYLIRRMRSDRVMVVFTERPGPRQRHAPLEADLLCQPYCCYIRLEPLSAFAVGALLITERDYQPSAQRFAGALHRMSGGNPLLVKALLEDSCDADGEMSGVDPGEAFQQAILQCLYRCDPPELDVARAIAVFGTSVSPALLGSALGMGPQSVTEVAEALTMAGLLEGTRFRHEAAAAVVLQSIPPGERAVLHAAAARALHDAGEPASVVAEHLLSAGESEAPWGVTVLREAAEHALDSAETDRASLLLKLARRHCADDRERALTTSLIARAEWRVDPSSAGRLLPELTAAVRHGLLTGRPATRTLDYLLWHGRPHEAAELLGSLNGNDGRSSLEAARPHMDLLYPATFGRAPSSPAAPVHHDAVAEAFTSRMAAIHTSTANADDLFTGAEQVLQGTRLDDSTLIPIAAAISALIHSGSLDKAVFWSESLATEAKARRAPAWEALLASLRAMTELRRGDLHAAHRYSSKALTAISDKSWGVFIGLPLASMVLAATGLGDLDRAEAYLDVPYPEEMFQTRACLHYLEARGWYQLASGQLHAALGDFQVCGERMGRWGLDLPAIVPWRSAAAYAYAKLGREGEGRALVEEQLGMTAPWDHRTRGLSLRALARTSDLKKRRSLLFDAVETLERSYDRLELARALTDLSRVLQELGEYGAARRTARRADHLAQVSGAEGFDRTAFALAPPAPAASGPGGAPAVTDDLSKAELRVATLAADGYTNRQIAAKLFVTVSTVEQHLTRVYRKLNLSRRMDLASVLPPET